jgi:hypothetical protein
VRMAAIIFFRGLRVSAAALVEDEIRNDLDKQTSITNSVTISIPQMANAAYTIPRRRPKKRPSAPGSRATKQVSSGHCRASLRKTHKRREGLDVSSTGVDSAKVKEEFRTIALLRNHDC